MFRALGEPVRLRLLALMQRGAERGQEEICVCDLVAALASPQPTVSRHLGYLRRCGLVACRREGPWCHYRLARPADAVHRKVLECVRACRATDAALDAMALPTTCGPEGGPCR